MSEVLGSKLSDKIRVEGLKLFADGLPLTSKMHQEARRLQEVVNKSPVFYTQNVAEYFFKLVRQDAASLVKLNVENLPCIAPPYPSFFTEFKMPNNTGAGNSGISRVGVVFEAIGKNQAKDVFDESVLEQAKWILSGTTVVDYPDSIPLAVTSNVVAIAENGAVVPSTRVKSTVTSEMIEGWILDDEPVREKILREQFRDVITPGLLAITFTHCKGTEIREIAPPSKLSRAIEKKTGQPLLKYHVIDVNPFRQVLTREGNVERVGINQALTSVRGHFADYRENGLFRKNHGIYWKPDYERGDQANGIIRKDYNINTPQ